MTMPLVYSWHNHGSSYGYGQLTGDRGETKKKKDTPVAPMAGAGGGTAVGKAAMVASSGGAAPQLGLRRWEMARERW